MYDTVGSIHVTKLAAAQRQLRAAIRMFFLEEDDLAIHTVAAAAYRVLADLKDDRGRDEVGDYYLTAIFYAVRDFRRGTLPSYFTNDPDAMAWIREAAAQLPIRADSKFSDVIASVSVDTVAHFWRKRNAVSNFLKHADRDPKAHIALEAVDNLQLLMQAASAYVDLVHDGLESEGLVLWLYCSVVNEQLDGLPEKWRPVAHRIASRPNAERKSFCYLCIRQLNATE